MTISFLLDENLSPETARFLEQLGYACYSILRDGPLHLQDAEIVALAKQDGRIVITHDLDFGQIYYSAEQGEIGVLVLRLRDQTVEAVNVVLRSFLSTSALTDQELQHSLVILTENAYRVFRGPRGRL